MLNVRNESQKNKKRCVRPLEKSGSVMEGILKGILQ